MGNEPTKASRIIYYYELQERKCYYCKRLFFVDGKVLAYSIDHKLPKSRGGKNTLENQCLACVDCNSVKGNMTEEEFLPILEKIMKSQLTIADVREYAQYLTLKRKFEEKGITQ